MNAVAALSLIKRSVARNLQRELLASTLTDDSRIDVEAVRVRHARGTLDLRIVVELRRVGTDDRGFLRIGHDISTVLGGRCRSTCEMCAVRREVRRRVQAIVRNAGTDVELESIDVREDQ